ncbi:MAG: 30S ribosomal protein S12 methylthiotransferase RimO [Myxococcales bacterium]|nr:30S ribosomal protein S12 methylthiotransferase RimO [Myxococcales bacterium]
MTERIEPAAAPAPKKVYFVSLGCPKNQVDTEVMLGVVKDQGHVLVDTAEEADTLVVNTCGFIEEAKQESIETILELAQAKAQGKKRLVVAGCLSQRYPDELAKEMPEVDNFLGSADMLGLANVLREQAPRMGVTPLGRRAYLYDHNTPRQVSGRRHSAYIKIAEGCDRPCAFCIIPKLRGPQRSREIASIVAEAEALAAAGTREVCLIAQDLTTYGTDLEVRTSFENLLAALCNVDDLRWIRLHYAFPTTVTDPIIKMIAGEPKIATYIDVPLQHVDTEVLRRMRRGYTEKSVRTLVEKLRAESNYIHLRTTMLVGHPGETEEAFQRLYNFVEEGAIDHLGVFPWSREDGTPSALLPGRVDPEVAEERRLALMELQEEIRLARHESMIDRTIEVLVDGVSDESEFLLDARHEGQAPGIDGKVILADGTAEPGSFVRARVTQADAHDLVATLEV